MNAKISDFIILRLEQKSIYETAEQRMTVKICQRKWENLKQRQVNTQRMGILDRMIL